MKLGQDGSRQNVLDAELTWEAAKPLKPRRDGGRLARLEPPVISTNFRSRQYEERRRPPGAADRPSDRVLIVLNAAMPELMLVRDYCTSSVSTGATRTSRVAILSFERK